MKRCKSIFSALLAMVMLLSCLTMLAPSAQAETTGYTTGSAMVYDLYDLSGETTKTIFGRIQTGTWDQQIGKVAEEHKGNVAFTAKMTVGSAFEHIFIGLGMTGANASSTSDGYIFEIQAKAGEPDAVVYHKKGAPWQASSQGLNFDFNGTYVLEVGVVDLYQDGTLVGKRAYVKANGADVCHWDDTNPVTTENLGTTVGIYNEQNNITLESTYESGFGADNVYDIYNLTGAISNSFNGTGNGNWSASVFGNVDASDKENVTFKANVSVSGGNEFRLSLSALDSKDCVDVAGYGLVFHFGMSKLIFARNGSWIVSWDMNNADMMGEYELEFGYRDILVNNKTVGKQIFLKKNGEIVHTYDDVSGYLTGDALGTKIALFHYGTVVQMNSTYENGYGSANVYDIADLTGATEKNVDAWNATKIGSVSVEHKEQAAVKFNMNMTNDVRHRYRFSLGAQEGADCTDIKGYGMEIGIEFDGQNYVRFQRNSDWIATFSDISGILGEHDFEFGYRNITFGNTVIGKQVYLSVDGVELYTYDENANYLTGDALGTEVALHHIDDAVAELKSTYEIGYGTEKVYDISDLTGAASNSFNGTGNGNWSASVFGNVDAADKENFSIKANVSIIDGNEWRLSLAALDEKDCVDVTGYGLVLHFGMSKLIFARNGNWDISWDMNNADMMGQYELEFGYRSITLGSNIIGKQIFVKKNGEVLHTYDNMNGYLTGDALGTKVALFHYGTTVQMNTTLECTTHDYSVQTVAPDCLNDGKIIYTCTVCGHTYSEQGDGALGHEYVSTASYINEVPTITHDCSRCDAVQTIELNFYGSTVSMGNTLAVYYYTDRDIDGIEDLGLKGFENISVNFSCGAYVGENSQNVSIDDAITNVPGYYKFPCRYITPSQMGDEITAIISGSFNGTTYTFKMDNYSVKQYCLNRIKASDSTAEEQKMLVDMLYYCDASRAYTTYKANESVTGDLTAHADAHAERIKTASYSSILNKAYAETSTEKANWVAATIELDNSVRMRLRFETINGVEVSDLTAKATVGGREMYAYVVQKNGAWYVYVVDLAYAQLGEEVLVTLYEGDIAVSDTICYSVESYAAAKLNDTDTDEELVALLKALMCYGDSAEAYFGK